MRTKREVYVHVGYPKTGTTTLQKHFFPKIEEIQYLGKHYGEDGFLTEGYRELLFEAHSDDVYEKLKREFEARLSKQKIVISDEHFFAFQRILRETGYAPENDAQRLRKLFDETAYDVKIIVTLRKQDEMITSAYAQGYVDIYSRYHEYDTFEKFAAFFMDEAHRTHRFREHLDYDKSVSDYVRVFGREHVFVLAFEALSETPNAFYGALCDLLDIDAERYGEVAVMKHENSRRSASRFKKRPKPRY